MANLNLRQKVTEILKQRKNDGVIRRAIRLENRIKFHSETNIDISDVYSAAYDFLDFVERLLPKDKFELFKTLFGFPLSSSAVVEDVYRELSRVFYSRNAMNTYHFTDSTSADDWHIYQANNLKSASFWKNEAWQAMITNPNSIIIVDSPTVIGSSKPEPYIYFENIENVVDFETTDGTNLIWVLIQKDENSVLFISNEVYATFKIKNNEVIDEELIVNHGLGECPARFFWTDSISDQFKSVKRNPITKQLTRLDWFLFFDTSKKHLDLYAPYPIYSAYEAECDYENNETGDYCDGGFLRNQSGNYIHLHTGIAKCPICDSKRIAGPGSFLEVPIPRDNDHDLSNPVNITTIDKDSLDYNTKELERLKNSIVVSCVGSNGLVSEKEAINVDQIAANFENKTSVLNRLKVNFENAQEFAERIICKIRYRSSFISVKVNWGSEFFIFSVSELYAKYAEAKKSGASVYELDSLSDQIIETEYKDNQNMLQRMKILKHIEPLRHQTLSEASANYKAGIVSIEDVVLKSNLSSYVDRFERENTNIVDFGSYIDFNEKIEIIKTIINKYLENDVKKINDSRKGEAAATEI